VNIGLIIMLVLLISQLIGTGVVLFLRKNKQKYLNDLIHHDCVVFDANKISIEEYFNRNKIKNNSDVKVSATDTIGQNLPSVHASNNVNNNIPGNTNNSNTQLSRHSNHKNSIKSSKPSLADDNHAPIETVQKKEDEFDTTRYLKDDANPHRSPELRRPSENMMLTQNLRLHEESNNDNNNPINEVVNNNANDVAGGINNVDGEKIDEIKIYHNFIDQKNPGDVTDPRSTDSHQNTQSGFRPFIKSKDITMMDYETLTHDERFKFDNRTFTKYLWDSMTRRNMILSIFYKYSVIDPSYIRVGKLVFAINLIFGFNAILFDDQYIDGRALGNYQVK
jgi:hypothetical protein